MRIGELATASDVSRDTIRYYEKAGLLNGAVSGRTDNNYRVYAREAVDPFAFMGCCPDICFAIQVFSR